MLSFNHSLIGATSLIGMDSIRLILNDENDSKICTGKEF